MDKGICIRLHLLALCIKAYMKHRGLFAIGTVCTLAAVVLAVLVSLLTDPWPRIADKEALVQECAEWLIACREAKMKGEIDPPLPESIARISLRRINVASTRAMEDHVRIFVGSEDPRFFFCRQPGEYRFSCLFYCVFPLERDNPEYRPRKIWPCKKTSHARIFKTWEIWTDDAMTSGFVEITSGSEY